MFNSDSKCWSPDIKKVLGPEESASGFPPQLTPSGVKSLLIPAVGFHEAAPFLKLEDLLDL